MKAINERALDFVKTLQRLYLEQRDIKSVLELIDDDVFWIGTGESEYCHNKAEAEVYLWKELKLAPYPYIVWEADYEVKSISDYVCAVQCILVLQEKQHAEIFEKFKVRVSVVCKEYEDGFRLKEVHMSVPSHQQAEEDALPRVLGKDSTTLARFLDEQSKQLIRNNSDLNALIQNVPGGVMCCDSTEDLNLIEYSDGFVKMFGYSREEIKTKLGNKFINMIYPPDVDGTWESVREQLKYENSKRVEYRVVCKDGRLMTVLDHGQYVKRDGENVFYCILTDITESKRTMEELRLSLERHRIIMEQTTDIIFEWDVESDTVKYSDKWKEKFGYEGITRQASKAHLLHTHIHDEDRAKFGELVQKMFDLVPYAECELRISNAEGVYLWCRIRATLQVGKDGRAKSAVGVIQDIDYERKKTEKLQAEAQRDTLTGLYNKGTAQRLTQKYLSRMKEGEMAAFLMVDVDDFKRVNDVYGHLSGDVILTEVASNMKRIFRKEDIIGRIGGDEFGILIKDIDHKQDVYKKAKELIHAFHNIPLQEKFLFSCSIGIVFAPEGGTHFTELYEKADTALYDAKKQGKNNYALYDETRHNKPRLPEEFKQAQTKKNIESETGLHTKENEFAQYIFMVLYRTYDMKKAIAQVMKITGKHFDISRVYIIQHELGKRKSRKIQEWCNEGIHPIFQGQGYIKEEVLHKHYEKFNDQGILYYKDARGEESILGNAFPMQGPRSVLQCILFDQGEKRGIIGFEHCCKNKLWTEEQASTLSVISEVISVFLVKEQMREQLSRQNQKGEIEDESQRDEK